MNWKKWLARILRAKEDQCLNASEQRMYITEAIEKSIAAPINSAACSMQALVTHLKTDKIPKFALFFTGVALVLNSAMLWVVYGQLRAYQVANTTTQASLEEIKRTDMESKAPWISIRYFYPKLSNGSLVFYWLDENHSDAPALHLQMWIGIIVPSTHSEFWMDSDLFASAVCQWRGYARPKAGSLS